MPFTEEFNKLRKKFALQYEDRAKAETFAFKEAFLSNTPTFRTLKLRFKKQGNILVNFLFWIMALISVCLLLPTFINAMTTDPAICNFTNGAIICFIIHYFPIFLIGMLVLILFILMRQ